MTLPPGEEMAELERERDQARARIAELERACRTAGALLEVMDRRCAQLEGEVERLRAGLKMLRAAIVVRHVEGNGIGTGRLLDLVDSALEAKS